MLSLAIIIFENPLCRSNAFQEIFIFSSVSLFSCNDNTPSGIILSILFIFSVKILLFPTLSYNVNVYVPLSVTVKSPLAFVVDVPSGNTTLLNPLCESDAVQCIFT